MKMGYHAAYLFESFSLKMNKHKQTKATQYNIDQSSIFAYSLEHSISRNLEYFIFTTK